MNRWNELITGFSKEKKLLWNADEIATSFKELAVSVVSTRSLRSPEGL